jgi:hypothetical protein
MRGIILSSCVIAGGTLAYIMVGFALASAG